MEVSPGRGEVMEIKKHNIPVSVESVQHCVFEIIELFWVCFHTWQRFVQFLNVCETLGMWGIEKDEAHVAQELKPQMTMIGRNQAGCLTLCSTQRQDQTVDFILDRQHVPML